MLKSSVVKTDGVKRTLLLSTLVRRLRLSVHPDIIDKDVYENRHYVEGWTNVEQRLKNSPPPLRTAAHTVRTYLAIAMPIISRLPILLPRTLTMASALPKPWKTPLSVRTRPFYTPRSTINPQLPDFGLFSSSPAQLPMPGKCPPSPGRFG